jgi:MscS family membrane protein
MAMNDYWSRFTVRLCGLGSCRFPAHGKLNTCWSQCRQPPKRKEVVSMRLTVAILSLLLMIFLPRPALAQVQTPSAPAAQEQAATPEQTDAAAPDEAGAAAQDATGEAPRLGKEVENAAVDISNRLSEWISAHTGAWGQVKVLGIQVWRYAASFLMMLVTFIIARLSHVFFRKYAAKLASYTRWQTDDLLFECADKPAALLVIALGLYISALPLLGVLDERLQFFCGRLALTVAAIAVLWFGYRVIGVLDYHMRRLAARTDSDIDDALIDILRKTLRVFLLIVGGLFIGQTILNLNLTALLASAGILGLAIAFAAQDTIANIFGTLMLLLDRPFKVGDRILLEDADGPVESIGLRSTRIRTLDGHLVSVPNKQTANVKVQNVGRRPYIKRVSNITITYDTPADKVEKALQIVRGILDNHEGMDPEFPPRVYFNEFNDWSLNLLVIAWYTPPEYWDYLQWCEKTNLAIMRAFEAEGIEFAFPTSTTYLAQDDRRPLQITTRPAIPGKVGDAAGQGTES